MSVAETTNIISPLITHDLRERPATIQSTYSAFPGNTLTTKQIERRTRRPYSRVRFHHEM